MKTYNKLMVTLWLVLAILITLFVTYKTIMEGVNRWGFMYVFAAMAFMMYFLRRYMYRKVEKGMNSGKEK
jgi:hypothetical protein